MIPTGEKSPYAINDVSAWVVWSDGDVIYDYYSSNLVTYSYGI